MLLQVSKKGRSPAILYLMMSGGTGPASIPDSRNGLRFLLFGSLFVACPASRQIPGIAFASKRTLSQNLATVVE